MTIEEAINFGTRVLQDNEVVEPKRESALLLSLAIQKDRTFLIAHADDEVEPAALESFKSYIDRRAAHEPFQYISGHQEFFGLDFYVTPDVLIPRPETEILVEAAIEILRTTPQPSFCEVGVGSGCISVSLLHTIKNCRGVAGDVSKAAINVARRNAETQGVADRLDLRISDVFEAIEPEQFDLIVSNPPYVPSDQIPALQPEVRIFEPHSSLTDGKDGLSIIRRLVKDSPALLRHAGGLLIEIGFDQSESVVKMFDNPLWKKVEMLPDLQGIPRIVNARLK
jgi:release factor glutamine methyltransferase